MRHKGIIFVILFLFFACHTYADITLPTVAMGKPVLFQNEEKSHMWEIRAKQRDWGEFFSEQLWQVYVDREGVNAYSEPNRGAEVLRTFHFMDEKDVLYVAKISGDFALLYTEKRDEANLNISASAQALGWVHLDELLLWSSCPRTPNQVYQKALILKNAQEVIDNRDFWNSSPEFSKSPNSMIGTKRRVTDLEYYFVYKIVNGAALLLPDNKINNRIYTSKMGWMAKDSYTLWYDRLCYEPNFGLEMYDQVAVAYPTPAEVRNAKVSMIEIDTTAQNDFLWYANVVFNRWAPNKTRLPVLSKDNDDVAQVGVVSTYNASTIDKSKYVKEIDALRDKLNQIQKEYSTINVVFVMDGTPSMRRYYEPVSQAVTQAMAQKEMQGAEINFGAVIYRDYADEHANRMVQTHPLTSDYKAFISWLNRTECRTLGKKKFGAMYQGLTTALDSMLWNENNCNFIILVGDISNDPNDQRTSTDKIAQKMAEFKINFIAFQANHPDLPEYHNFSLQVQQIMRNELEKITGKKIRRDNFVLADQLYTYRNSDYEIISACFRFAEINKNEPPENLKNLIEDRIVSFKRQVNENLVILQTVLEGLSEDPENSGTDLSSEAIAFLNAKGLSPLDIQLLKQQNITLKVKGYTSKIVQNREVLAPSLFLSQQELNLLIDNLTSLNKIMRYSKDNIRANLKDGLTAMAKTYVGSPKEYKNMFLGDIFARISGSKNVESDASVANMYLDEIENETLLTNTQVKRFVKQINKDLDKLVLIREDPTYYYDSKNGLRYYYILVEDMPFQMKEKMAPQKDANSSMDAGGIEDLEDFL